MCGIIGYIGIQPCIEYILKGLILLQNRGYDSAGISIVDNNKIHTLKYASTDSFDSIHLLKESIHTQYQFMESTIGIGHTRWATHGGKTDINAHPHHDTTNTISIVHNGIIENFNILKDQLATEGIYPISGTDTEIIALLIGKYIQKGDSVLEAVQKTTSSLIGSWALAIIHKDYPNKLWVACNGSPLLMNITNSYIIVASEKIAFGSNSENYIVLKDGDILEISQNQSNFTFSKDIHSYKTYKNIQADIEYTPDPYSHWMLKEIMEQPTCIYKAIDRYISNNTVIFDSLTQFTDILLNINHIILLGCGTSYNAGLWSLPILKQLGIFASVSIYDGAEFTEYDIPKYGNTAFILLSQSGETKDLIHCMNIAKKYSIFTIGLINVYDSLLTRLVNTTIYLHTGREVAVASTKSFTNQCIILTLIGVWFSQIHKNISELCIHILEDIHTLPIQLQIVLDNCKQVNAISEKILKSPSYTSMFLLGKSKSYAIALESALKLKEIAYIHAEGYSSSALKHGPFALITDGLPIILFDIDEDYREKNNNIYNEIKARNAHIICISDIIRNTYSDNKSDNKSDKNSTYLYIPKNRIFGGILANCYIQLLSYYIAIHNKYNPDFPRNLAKVVTVE